jgi:hypothetical protein
MDLKKTYLHVLAEAKRIMQDVSPYFNEHYPSVKWDTEFPAVFEAGPNFYELEHI